MLIVGHRGGAEEAPENTIAALQAAIANGIYHFEVDLRLSADAELVVIHDNSLKRTSDIDEYVDNLSSSALSKIPVNGRNGESTIGVPTLSALMQHCQPIHSIQLELKSDERTDKDKLIHQLDRWLQKQDKQTLQSIIVTSFDTSLIAALKRRPNTFSKNVRAGIISYHPIEPALEQCLSTRCDYLCVDHNSVEQWTPTLIKQLTISGLHVSAWTVNDVPRLKRMRELPIHSIISDCPTLLSAAS